MLNTSDFCRDGQLCKSDTPHSLTLPFYKNIQRQQMHQLVKTLVAKLDNLSSVFMYHMERKN